MSEAVTAIESLSGKGVMLLAPSSPSVEVLRAQGFARANTLQQFKLNPELQEAVKGQVLWMKPAFFRPADAQVTGIRDRASLAWLNARTGTLTMTWSTVLAWLAMTGHSSSLIEMKTGAVANNLALVEYDLALINASASSHRTRAWRQRDRDRLPLWSER